MRRHIDEKVLECFIFESDYGVGVGSRRGYAACC